MSEDKFSQEADERKAKKEESQVQLTPSAQASSDSAYETYIISLEGYPVPDQHFSLREYGCNFGNLPPEQS